MSRIGISQPMFFPWVGLFEQIRLADTYVHYDDVQFPRGGFVNRVQIKMKEGTRWLTVPLRDAGALPMINQVMPHDRKDWRKQHLTTLAHAYASAPFKSEMLSLVEAVYAGSYTNMADLAIESMARCCHYLEIGDPSRFLKSSELGIGGYSSQRVADIVTSLGGTIYITGHGARHYLDHSLFEERRIRVEYMDYRMVPYQQLHGVFTPFVSVLDLIANKGRQGREVITSTTAGWRDFLSRNSRSGTVQGLQNCDSRYGHDE